MYDFDYLSARSVAEAIAAVGTDGDGTFIAGGMTMIPSLKQRLASPRLLVDITGIEAMRHVRLEGTDLILGGLLTHDTVMRSSDVRRSIPALASLAGVIGDPQVRNRGTLGGSVACNDPAADYPAALVGLGATVVTDRRRIEADAFFRGMFETLLAPDELVVEVSFPVPYQAGYVKLRQPASRYALAGVFVARTPSGVRVAVTGAGPCVFRHLGMEEALEEDFAPETPPRIATLPDGLLADMHASAKYRAHLVGVAASRAVAVARRGEASA